MWKDVQDVERWDIQNGGCSNPYITRVAASRNPDKTMTAILAKMPPAWWKV